MSHWMHRNVQVFPQLSVHIEGYVLNILLVLTQVSLTLIKASLLYVGVTSSDRQQIIYHLRLGKYFVIHIMYTT
jgi:hypothetical protein